MAKALSSLHKGSGRWVVGWLGVAAWRRKKVARAGGGGSESQLNAAGKLLFVYYPFRLKDPGLCATRSWQMLAHYSPHLSNGSWCSVAPVIPGCCHRRLQCSCSRAALSSQRIHPAPWHFASWFALAALPHVAALTNRM